MKQRLTCLDLFCGAGGLSKGFLDAGYDVVLGVDWDDAALETFQRNHGKADAMKTNTALCWKVFAINAAGESPES